MQVTFVGQGCIVASGAWRFGRKIRAALAILKKERKKMHLLTTQDRLIMPLRL